MRERGLKQPNGLSPAGRCWAFTDCQRVGLNPLTCDYKFVVKVPFAKNGKEVTTTSSSQTIFTSNNQQVAYSATDGFE